MSIARIARQGKRFAFASVATGGSQNFLGARWISCLVDRSPEKYREHIAMRLLSLSPHYFYDHDVRTENDRNRESRQALVDAIIAPYMSEAAQVIDYGCGPGYMAHAVAERVDHVDAVDISRGVLACAKVLNGRANISYLTPEELWRAASMADLAYSFAVVQHLRTEALVGALGLLADKIRHGGILLLHFAVPSQEGWRTQADWEADQSIACRTKLRYGLNCFGRSAQEMKALVSANGFADITVQSLDGSITLPADDDIAGQHLLIARRQ